MKRPNVYDFQKGDVLIYGDWSLVGLLISLRTWCKEGCHVEIYAGDHQSVASRATKGVGLYLTRMNGLHYWLRPNKPFDFEAGMAWFTSNAQGTPYGYLTLAKFFLTVNWLLTKLGFTKHIHGLICSEFGDLFFYNATCRLFNPDYPAGTVAPRDYLVTPNLDLLWSRHKS